MKSCSAQADGMGSFQATEEDLAVGEGAVGAAAVDAQGIGEDGEAVAFARRKEALEDGNGAVDGEFAAESDAGGGGIEEAPIEAGVVGKGGMTLDEVVSFLEDGSELVAIGAEHAVGDSGEACDVPRDAARNADEAAHFATDFEVLIDPDDGDFGDLLGGGAEAGGLDIDDAKGGSADDFGTRSGAFHGEEKWGLREDLASLCGTRKPLSHEGRAAGGKVVYSSDSPFWAVWSGWALSRLA